MIEFFKRLFRPKPEKEYVYGVFCRGMIVNKSESKLEAEQWIKETYETIMSKPQRTRSGFGGTYNTSHKEQWQGFRCQMQIRKI